MAVMVPSWGVDIVSCVGDVQRPELEVVHRLSELVQEMLDDLAYLVRSM